MRLFRKKPIEVISKVELGNITLDGAVLTLDKKSVNEIKKVIIDSGCKSEKQYKELTGELTKLNKNLQSLSKSMKEREKNIKVTVENMKVDLSKVESLLTQLTAQ